MKGKLRVVIGLLLSALVIAYILNRVDTAAVWTAITNANIAILVLSALVATLTFPLRALRWQAILRPEEGPIPLGGAWRATAIGFALNNALPLRIGEVARAYALTREVAHVSFPASFASLALERVFDAVILIALLVVGMLGLPALADASRLSTVYSGVVATGIVAGVLVVGLLALAFFPSRIIGIYEFFARQLSPALEARGSALLTSFASGLSVLRSPGRFVAVLLWSLAVWLTNALAFWIGFKAFGLEASYLAALVTQTAVAFAIAVPQAPSGLGMFQAAGAAALVTFGMNEDIAIAWGFAYWAFSFVPITTIGFVYFARMGMSLKDLRGVVNRIKGSGTQNANG